VGELQFFIALKTDNFHVHNRFQSFNCKHLRAIHTLCWAPVGTAPLTLTWLLTDDWHSWLDSSHHCATYNAVVCATTASE